MIYFDLDSFVTDVQEYRRRQELTFTQLAELCGVRFHTIKKILTRKSEPQIRTIAILANIADLSLDHYRKDPHGDLGGRLAEIKGRSRATSSSWTSVREVS